MKVTLYQLRENGGKLPEKEWRQQRLGPGLLTTCYMGMEGRPVMKKVMAFVERIPIGGQATDLVNPLYDFELIAVGSDRLRISGVQLTHDKRAVIQEWVCELVRD